MILAARRLGPIALLATAAVLMLPSAANGQERSCELIDEKLGCFIVGERSGGPNDPSPPSPSPGPASVQQGMPNLHWQDAGALGVVRGSCGTAEAPGGLHLFVLVNTVTGDEVDRQVTCVTPDQPNPSPPPPPPPPPSLAEFVRAAAALLTVQTSLNPRAEIGGLTGLDTWLWCEHPTTVQVGVSLRGWTAAATMNAVAYRWSIDGTDSASFTASSCGSEPSPAATWMPETMGPYTVTLTSTWSGSWTLSYSGVGLGTFALGPVDFAAPPVPYPVDEYRGVLTPPGVEL